jgi:hypothetical protein
MNGMTIALIRYDAARKALAAAHRVDEVKRIHDKATALLAYAKQAGDLTLQNQAAEIRILAERRAGQLLVDMNNTGQRQAKRNGRPQKVSSSTTLPKLGISRDQSSKWQRLALQISDASFEEALDRARKAYGELTTAGVLRMVKEVVRPKTTRTEQDINEICDDIIRETERRRERLDAVVELKERLNPTLRKRLIDALSHESASLQTLSAGFKDFERNGKAFQRQIREHLATLNEPDIEAKRQLGSSLRNAEIREISFEDAKGVLLQNEWLGSVTGEYFFGLYFGQHLAGAVAFGSTAGTEVSSSVAGTVHKDKVTVLVRGCCCFWAPKDSGSYLIAGACRKMAVEKGKSLVVGFSDTESGEQGHLYKICNFLFCGETRATEKFKTPDGRIKDARLVSAYTRDRRFGQLRYKSSRAEQKETMLKEGYEFFRGKPKLRWVGLFGNRRTKRILRSALKWPVLPYPKRQQPANVATQPHSLP